MVSRNRGGQVSLSDRVNNRSVAARIAAIHRIVWAGRFPSAAKLAEILEVSSKTVYRDLDYMRNFLNLPISYDHSRFGYRYTQKVKICPLCSMRFYRKAKHVV